MTSRIPRTFIDDVLLRTDIVDIISERVRLRKTGKNYSGLCPFHQEKTPSFSVSPDKQFFHCFGCGKSGNAIGFLMENDQFTFIEAIELLAQRAGMSVPTTHQTKQPQQDHQRLYDVLTEATQFYQTQLQQHANHKHINTYLHKRGLTQDVIEHFQLGYAPPGWENLLRHTQHNGYNTTELLQAGLIIEKNPTKCYDRFRERVMFPIRDYRGRVIAFGGRVLDDSQPKYLNSPETPVFHKSQELYGLYEARRAYNDLHSVILVEGYMDVLGLYQHGVRCGVATLGTAVSTAHFQRLFRYTDRVICCFDGDNAGRSAAWRALEASLPCLSANNSVCFLLLPDGDDPDSLILKEGKDGFIERVKTAIPFSDFLLTQIQAQHSLTSIDGRARFLQALKPLLVKLTDPVLHTLLIERIAELCRTTATQINQLLNTDLTTTPANVASTTPIPTTQRLTPMRLAISLLLQHPHIAKHVKDIDSLAAVDLPGIEIILELLAQLQQNPTLTTAVLLEHWRDSPYLASLNQLASWRLMLPDEGIIDELTGALTRIKQHACEQQVENLVQKAKQTTLSPAERQQLQRLLQQQATHFSKNEQ